MVVDYISASSMLRISFDNGSKDESVSHVFLKSIGDFLRLYKSATWYKNEDGADELYTPYIGEAKTVFDDIVKRRLSRKRDVTVDFSKSFITNVGGTSKLILQESKGTIQLARRSERNTTSKNCVCINDYLRDKFIFDCKTTVKKNKYAIDVDEEEDMFNKWKDIIKTEYIRQYLEVKPQ